MSIFPRLLALITMTILFYNSMDGQSLGDNKKQKPKLKTSLNAYSFNEPLTNGTMNIFDLLEYCSELGFDAVDLTAYYFPGYPKVPDDSYLYKVKQKAFLLGLDISGTGVRNNFTNPDSLVRAQSIDLVKSWIIASEKMGIPIIRIFAGEALPKGHTQQEVTAYMIEDIKKCVDFGRQHGVVVAIQNHWDFIKTSAQTIDIIEKVNSDWFGLILDIGSFKIGDPYIEISKTIPYATSWQIKENVFVDGVEQKTDLTKLISMILKSNYRGYIPIETLGKGDPKVKVEKFYKEVNKTINQLIHQE